MTEASDNLKNALAAAERKDWAEAVRPFIPLAEAGDATARCNVASMYWFGWGLPVDGHKAAELYLDVAERGLEEEHLSALACHNLATLYITGAPGFERDLDKSRAVREAGKGGGVQSRRGRVKAYLRER